MDRINKTNEEWKKELPEDVYHVTREAGTEPAFQNEFWDMKEDGVYKCSNCGETLFESTKKFDSGTGWPSFFDAKPDTVETREDRHLFMKRTEALCAKCGAHLGHVFPDGPEPTGNRFCINSLSLSFDEDETSKEEKK